MNWIDVREEKPLEDVWILFSDGKTVEMGIYMDGKFVLPDLQYLERKGARWWMSMPKPPEEK